MSNDTVSIVLTKRECDAIAQCLRELGKEFEALEETFGEPAPMDPKRLLTLSKEFRKYAEPDH